MSLILSGTDGLSDIDGSAATPAIRGTDTNTGIFFPAADTIAFSEGGAEAMRIDSSGNVGIGTSSPSSRLHLSQSDSTTSYYFAPQIRLQNTNTTNGTGESILFTSSANVVFAAIEGVRTTDSTHTGDLVFRAGSNATPVPERARIDSSGNLLVGQTSWNFANNGTQIAASGRIFNTSSTDYNMELAGAQGGRLRFYTSAGGSGTTVGSIAVTTSATAYNTSSDYRLKENIQPMTGALATVAQLNPVTYNWKVDGSDGQGFIAHELQAVVPDCVTGEKDAVENYTDKEGNEQTRPVYQGIDTSFLVATLTAAIKELKAELDAVKAELAAIKGA